jgi:hypothetical protein
LVAFQSQDGRRERFVTAYGEVVSRAVTAAGILHQPRRFGSGVGRTPRKGNTP